MTEPADIEPEHKDYHNHWSQSHKVGNVRQCTMIDVNADDRSVSISSSLYS